MNPLAHKLEKLRLPTMSLQLDQVFRDAVELNPERVLTKMIDRQTKSISQKLSVASMVDWTD